MDGAQVGVFEQVYHECFGGFLERLYSLALPAQGVAADGEEGETDLANLQLYQLESVTQGDGRFDHLRGGRMGVSAVVGRLSAGSDESLGGRPCRVCSGGPCGLLLRLYKGFVSAIVRGHSACCRRMVYCASVLGGKAPTLRSSALSSRGF